MGLKVYKPNDYALKQIVNYRDPNAEAKPDYEVDIGEVRYASTNRSFQGISNVPVYISPNDLLGQKTALFGMTRTGKSNTTKIIAKTVFELRFKQEAKRVGQVIFDPNGEYANENAQDNNSALKNVWKLHAKGSKNDVVTYGILPHPNDPERRIMLLNFYEDVDGQPDLYGKAAQSIQIGKEIIDAVLTGDGAKYIQNFQQVVFERPSESDRSALTRYKRRVLAYRALLSKAGFKAPENLKPYIKGLFNKELLEELKKSESEKAADYISAAAILGNVSPSWEQLHTALSSLYSFMSEAGYRKFEQWYVNERPSASGDTWADEDLKKILEMFKYPNGARQIGKARVLPEFFHCCFSQEVLKFLVVARAMLDWRSNEVDRTLMAFILIHLHGKRETSLSNQMRQSKAMSPEYSVRWWNEKKMSPPEVEPVSFLLKKLRWRYLKGMPKSQKSEILLGDSCILTKQVSNEITKGTEKPIDLLLTSPPYYGVTNYFVDQWLRLWMLGFSERPTKAGAKYQQNGFESKNAYRDLLTKVFESAAGAMSSSGVVYVRTDARKFTFDTTYEVLEKTFAGWGFGVSEQPYSRSTQTALYGDKTQKPGERDIVLIGPDR